MVLMLLACVRPLPSTLGVESAASPAAAPEPTDPAARPAWMIGEDPLARRPRIPSGALEPGLGAWRELALSNASNPHDWAELEAANPGTIAVPLSRGARLAALEISLGEPTVAMGWLLPLPGPPPTQDQVRPPLDWLHGAPPDTLLGIAERQVLLGWLDGPALPLDAAAHALEAPTYDRAATTPAGRLLLARGARRIDATARDAGFALLEEATWLAAMGAAADKDTEQAQARALRAAVAARTGLAGDPTHALLTRATDTLLADAGTDASVGYALLAQAALRWEGGCPDAPCTGFDRVTAMTAAARWDPTVVPLAQTWRVIAFKEALDHLEAAYDEATFPHALDGIVEVLLGAGGGLDGGVLRYARPGAPVQLALSRAAGGGDLTSRDDLFRTLKNRLAALARDASRTAPERLQEPLLRIAKRAE